MKWYEYESITQFKIYLELKNTVKCKLYYVFKIFKQFYLKSKKFCYG